MARVEDLLNPLSDDAPSGVDLNHDPAFTALERCLDPARAISRDATGTPVYSTSAIVDWDGVLEDGLKLAETGRDLRLLIVLTRARFALGGFAGLAETLTLLAQSIETYWDSLFPALRDRPKPADAARPRTNALRDLENRDNGLMSDILGHVFIPIPGDGVTGNDLYRMKMNASEITRISGTLSPDDERAAIEAQEARDGHVIKIAHGYTAENTDKISSLAADSKAAMQALAQLEAAVSKALGGNGATFALTSLSSVLTRIAEAFATLENGAPDTSVTNITATEGGAADGQREPGEAGSKARGGTLPNSLESREDVVRCLDLVIEFYQREEPSSPIPLIAKRLRRMVPMSFLDLMNEVAPSGLKEFRSVAGVTDTKGRSD